VHYLYVHIVENSLLFGGVTASYNVARDPSSATDFPSRVLTSHLPLADIIEQHVPPLYAAFEQCATDMNHRTTLMKVLRLFQRQRLLASSTESPQKSVVQLFEVLLTKEFASVENRCLHTTVPSSSFERQMAFRTESLEEPATKQLLKQYPDFAEAVQAEQRRWRTNNENCHIFDHLGVPLGRGLWWLMAADVTLTFSSFVSVVVELARFTFPLCTLDDALRKALVRLAERPRSASPKQKANAVGIPPSKIDGPLPRKRASVRPETAERQKSAPKKPAAKK
jgi:hypothetical protein